MKQNILKEYADEICAICENKYKCQEELRVRLDNTVKCYEYKSTFVPNKIDSIMYGTKW